MKLVPIMKLVEQRLELYADKYWTIMSDYFDKPHVLGT